jgi:hypothetical protein
MLHVAYKGSRRIAIPEHKKNGKCGLLNLKASVLEHFSTTNFLLVRI